MSGACSGYREGVTNFIYEPQQGSWFGGDRMLLYVDSLYKRRGLFLDQRSELKQTENEYFFFFSGSSAFLCRRNSAQSNSNTHVSRS